MINEKSALDFGAWLKIPEVTIVKLKCDRVDSIIIIKLAFQRINCGEQLRVNAIYDDAAELKRYW
jgi:hypothetical protein